MEFTKEELTYIKRMVENFAFEPCISITMKCTQMITGIEELEKKDKDCKYCTGKK